MNTRNAKTITGLVILLMVSMACSSSRPLMQAPNSYQGQTAEQVFADVPEEWHQSRMKLLYATDRKPRDDQGESFSYGSGRSPSLAFGTAIIEIDGDPTWEEFTTSSLNSNRKNELQLLMGDITELGRLPPTPYPASLIDGEIRIDPGHLAETLAVESRMNARFSELLSKTPRNEVVLYIHGYNNDFEDAALDLAEVWHFLGRKHLPVLYSWPAGHEGIPGMRGYNYDRESGEFTIYHLKQFLKSLGKLDEVEKVHIIAHSRGTDVLVTALRELFLEIRAEGKDPRKELRIANAVLAAPDLDYEVVLQRVVSEFLEAGVGQATVYTSPADKAIKISEWLYGSVARIGHLDSGVVKSKLTDEQMASIEDNTSVQFVEFIGKGDSVGHGYFSSSAAVSSDLIALINTGAKAGSAERPLIRKGAIYWVIDDGYPFIGANTK
jgi:esterase/lipase superfamily enzyme